MVEPGRPVRKINKYSSEGSPPTYTHIHKTQGTRREIVIYIVLICVTKTPCNGILMHVFTLVVRGLRLQQSCELKEHLFKCDLLTGKKDRLLETPSVPSQIPFVNRISIHL